MTHNEWTPEEVAILRKFYPTEGADGCAKFIKDHPIGSIATKARRLGITLTPETRNARMRRCQVQAVKRIEPVELPPEYMQASDIFQVGYRVACIAGVLDQYRRAA